jgi:spore maturation protein SpmA
MAMNYIWISFFIIGFLVGLYQLIFEHNYTIFSDIMNSMFDSAKTGFTISIGLTGMMALWLGIMKIGEKSGLIHVFAKLVQPLFKIIFKDIPDKHPAFGNIAMNFSANLLGLDNAATPLGLKAMDDMQQLNSDKNTATNAQIMFLVLNTAGIVLIPTSIIAMRQTLAIEQNISNFNAADIFLPILIITYIGLVAGIIVVSIFQKINIFKLPFFIFFFGLGGLIWLLWLWLSSFPTDTMNTIVGVIGALVIMSIILTFLISGLVKKINVYDTFIEGAKEGFQTAITIIPYLVAMLVAIAVLRSSGCMDYVVNAIASVVSGLGWNTDFVPALPVGIMKPLSGSGARGLMVDVMNTYGVNSFQGNVAAVLQGSTETTLYVLAVYFGSVNVKNTRYALIAGLIVDIICIITAIIIAYAFYHNV